MNQAGHHVVTAKIPVLAGFSTGWMLSIAEAGDRSALLRPFPNIWVRQVCDARFPA